jgi:16S rRNA G1207 methylase RsmC
MYQLLGVIEFHDKLYNNLHHNYIETSGNGLLKKFPRITYAMGSILNLGGFVSIQLSQSNRIRRIALERHTRNSVEHSRRNIKGNRLGTMTVEIIWLMSIRIGAISSLA